MISHKTLNCSSVFRVRYNVTIVRNIKGEELDTPPDFENGVSPEGKFDEEDYDQTNTTTQVPIDKCGLQVLPYLYTYSGVCTILCHYCRTARASMRRASWTHIDGLITIVNKVEVAHK